MKVDLGFERDIVGNKITISAQAEGDEKISSVVARLDNFDILQFDPPSSVSQYNNTLNQQGQAGPGMKHTLEVEVFFADGSGPYKATKEWTDPR